MISLAQLMTANIPADRPVAVDDSGIRCWQQFREQVAAVQQLLSAQPGQRWLLYEEDSYRFAVALMALLQCGKTPLLAPNGQPGMLHELEQSCAGRLLIADDCPSSATLSPSFQPLDLDRLSIDIATSGSTGDSRIFSKSLRSFEAELAVHAQMWSGQLADATVMATVSHQHIYGLLFRVLLPLCCGRPFWRTVHTYPEPLVASIAAMGQPVVIVSSPAHLSRLPAALASEPIRGRVALVLSSGGPLSLAAAQDTAAHFGVTPVEIFGSTETGGVAWRRQTGADQPWQPLPQVTLELVGEDNQLRVQSPFCVDTGGFTMGDVARFLDSGEFVLQGRADRIVKLEEKRLSLSAMEAHLQASPWVKQAKLLLLPGSRLQLAAVVEVSAEGAGVLQREGKRALNSLLKNYLLNHYERVLLPRKWRYFERMPLNSQGKLPLSDMRKLFQRSE